MLISEPKVFVFINCGRHVDYPYGVDFTSLDDFKTTMINQYEFESSQVDSSKKYLKAIRRYKEILELSEKNHGSFFRFRRDVCTTTIIVEFVFQNVNDMFNFKHQVNELKDVSAKYAVTLAFDGKNHLVIFPWNLSSTSGLCHIFEQAACENANDEKQATLYLDLACLFAFLKDLPFYRIKTIKNRAEHVEIDVVFKTFKDLTKSTNELGYAFN